MARQYKKNRARGSRKTTYNKKEYEFGNIKVSAKRNLTAKQYKEQFYNENAYAIEKAYQSNLRKAQKMKDPKPKAAQDFLNQYKDAKDWFTKTSKGISTVKGLKQAVETYYGEEIQRFRNNAWKRIMASEDFSRINDIFTAEEEQFDLNKLNYKSDTNLKEDAYYEYITKNGTRIQIRFAEAKDSSETGYVEITVNGR